MAEKTIDSSLPLTDITALLWFTLCWAGYFVYTRKRNPQRLSLLNAMDQWREEWALSLTKRSNRIMDSQVINGLVRKETFFDSTTILILASSVALMGAGDKHFNDGIRAYYFALAELTWFVNPLIFVAATTWVVIVLYRQEFHSKALSLLSTTKE